jgi:hypothetical protein
MDTLTGAHLFVPKNTYLLQFRTGRLIIHLGRCIPQKNKRLRSLHMTTCCIFRIRGHSRPLFQFRGQCYRHEVPDTVYPNTKLPARLVRMPGCRRHQARRCHQMDLWILPRRDCWCHQLRDIHSFHPADTTRRYRIQDLYTGPFQSSLSWRHQFQTRNNLKGNTKR